MKKVAFLLATANFAAAQQIEEYSYEYYTALHPNAKCRMIINNVDGVLTNPAVGTSYKSYAGSCEGVSTIDACQRDTGSPSLCKWIEDDTSTAEGCQIIEPWNPDPNVLWGSDLKGDSTVLREISQADRANCEGMNDAECGILPMCQWNAPPTTTAAPVITQTVETTSTEPGCQFIQPNAAGISGSTNIASYIQQCNDQSEAVCETDFLGGGFILCQWNEDTAGSTEANSVFSTAVFINEGRCVSHLTGEQCEAEMEANPNISQTQLERMDLGADSPRGCFMTNHNGGTYYFNEFTGGEGAECTTDIPCLCAPESTDTADADESTDAAPAPAPDPSDQTVTKQICTFNEAASTVYKSAAIEAIITSFEDDTTPRDDSAIGNAPNHDGKIVFECKQYNKYNDTVSTQTLEKPFGCDESTSIAITKTMKETFFYPNDKIYPSVSAAMRITVTDTCVQQKNIITKTGNAKVTMTHTGHVDNKDILWSDYTPEPTSPDLSRTGEKTYETIHELSVEIPIVNAEAADFSAEPTFEFTYDGETETEDLITAYQSLTKLTYSKLTCTASATKKVSFKTPLLDAVDCTKTTTAIDAKSAPDCLEVSGDVLGNGNIAWDSQALTADSLAKVCEDYMGLITVVPQGCNVASSVTIGGAALELTRDDTALGDVAQDISNYGVELGSGDEECKVNDKNSFMSASFKHPVLVTVANYMELESVEYQVCGGDVNGANTVCTISAKLSGPIYIDYPSVFNDRKFYKWIKIHRKGRFNAANVCASTVDTSDDSDNQPFKITFTDVTTTMAFDEIKLQCDDNTHQVSPKTGVTGTSFAFVAGSDKGCGTSTTALMSECDDPSFTSEQYIYVGSINCANKAPGVLGGFVSLTPTDGDTTTYDYRIPVRCPVTKCRDKIQLSKTTLDFKATLTVAEKASSFTISEDSSVDGGTDQVTQQSWLSSPLTSQFHCPNDGHAEPAQKKSGDCLGNPVVDSIKAVVDNGVFNRNRAIADQTVLSLINDLQSCGTGDGRHASVVLTSVVEVENLMMGHFGDNK